MNYVVGDIQGCLKGLKSLLKKVNFDPTKDKLWAVGDLVARGPHSLETLVFLRSLGDAFDTVLGNHDLHLIAIYFGIAKPKANDRLDSLVASNEFESLVTWLCTKPLAIRINKQYLMSHAGLYPGWSFKQAVACSDEVSTKLQSSTAKDFLQHMYGNQPDQWQKSLEGIPRLRFIVNAFTRMRFLNKSCLEFKHKCHPNHAPKQLTPWYESPNKMLKQHHNVLFGHWASMQGETDNPRFIGLDTGFVWGKQMTLFCLENKRFFTTSA